MSKKQLQTRNVLLSEIDLTNSYPNRKKVCIACDSLYFVSLKKVIGKSKFCTPICAGKNQARGYWNVGKSPSEATRKKISEALKGAKSYLWRGGITPINQMIRTSRKMREWRKNVFERDKYICQKCDSYGVFLQADHIKPFAYFPELRFEISNGRTLCKPCHKKTDTYCAKVRTKYPTLALKYKTT